MKIKLILIGDELLSGRIQDSNGHFFARFCSQKGHKLREVTILPDSVDRIIEELRDNSPQAELIVISGGLGPTLDDMTKASLSKLLGQQMIDSEEARAVAKSNYTRQNVTWSPNLNSYNMIPSGVTPINNPSGYAPGLCCEYQNKTIFCAPGVPHEFESMVTEELPTYLKSKNGNTSDLTIRTRGIAEERIFYELCPTLWEDLSKFGKVASLPVESGVDIVISNASAPSEIEELIKKTPLIEYIWQFGNNSIEQEIIEVATQKGILLSTAESCTGGLIADLLTNVSGSSQVFQGGAVTYSPNAKKNLLSVESEAIEKHSVYSHEVVEQMARGSRKEFGSSIAVATSGVASPLPLGEKPEVGTLFYAISTENETYSHQVKFSGDRRRLKRKFAYHTLFELLKEINKR